MLGESDEKFFAASKIASALSDISKSNDDDGMEDLDDLESRDFSLHLKYVIQILCLPWSVTKQEILYLPFSK